LISAMLGPQSIPRRAVKVILAEHDLLVTDAIQEEWADVVSRPKFDRQIPEDQRMEFLDGCPGSRDSRCRHHLIVACRDPKDDKFLEAAVAGTADAIVSGEADLLTLHPFRGISILSPTAFLAAVAPPLP